MKTIIKNTIYIILILILLFGGYYYGRYEVYKEDFDLRKTNSNFELGERERRILKSINLNQGQEIKHIKEEIKINHNNSNEDIVSFYKEIKNLKDDLNKNNIITLLMELERTGNLNNKDFYSYIDKIMKENFEEINYHYVNFNCKNKESEKIRIEERKQNNYLHNLLITEDYEDGFYFFEKECKKHKFLKSKLKNKENNKDVYLTMIEDNHGFIIGRFDFYENGIIKKSINLTHQKVYFINQDNVIFYDYHKDKMKIYKKNSQNDWLGIRYDVKNLYKNLAEKQNAFLNIFGSSSDSRNAMKFIYYHYEFHKSDQVKNTYHFYENKNVDYFIEKN